MGINFEKALSSNPGVGGDLIIPQLADQILPFIRQRSYLRQFLRSVNMPTETYKFPKLVQGASVYYVGEGTVAPDTSLTTGTVNLQAKKLMVALAISAELEEDSILPIVPVIRDDIAKAFALAEENAFINGDTTHLATADGTVTPITDANWYQYDHRRAYDGLLKMATETTTTCASANRYVDADDLPLSLANLSSAIEKLDVFGRDKSELLFICSLKEENRLRLLLGLNLQLNQLNLVGTALPGEIGKVFGIPVVATNLLNNSAGGTTTALLVNRNSAIIGDRRIFTIKSSDELLIKSDQLLIVASERLAFQEQYCQGIIRIINIG